MLALVVSYPALAALGGLLVVYVGFTTLVRCARGVNALRKGNRKHTLTRHVNTPGLYGKPPPWVGSARVRVNVK